jgi:hypothetical protein
MREWKRSKEAKGMVMTSVEHVMNSSQKITKQELSSSLFQLGYK